FRICPEVFTRAILMRSGYPCRDGRRKCHASRDQLACRRCRFGKCTTLTSTSQAAPLKRGRKKAVEKTNNTSTFDLFFGSIKKMIDQMWPLFRAVIPDFSSKGIDEQDPKEQQELKCRMCSFCTLSASEFIEHLSAVHDTSLMKQRLMLRCTCGFFVTDAQQEREHREFSFSACTDHERLILCSKVYELVEVRVRHWRMLAGARDEVD
ncbi:hypothetical protein PMAYCL1PPCAC_27295, partial [Pristionchus mayeri]